MALIILLILSEDDIFNKTIHNIPIKKFAWYTERSLTEISLGGLLILVVIRTIQFNMTRMRVSIPIIICSIQTKYIFHMFRINIYIQIV
jgi:hypothetical protein